MTKEQPTPEPEQPEPQPVTLSFELFQRLLNLLADQPWKVSAQILPELIKAGNDSQKTE